MLFKVRSASSIWLFTGVVALASICVPVAFISFFLPPWTPLFVRVPLYITLVAVPLLVATPLTFIVLQMFKKLNTTVDMLDHYIKFDVLTGLLSRGYFLSSVNMVRSKGGFLLALDADHFKSINDTFGHDAGDRALQAFARIINGLTADVGLAGRLGGEEFAVYLPGASSDAAKAIARSINAAVRKLEFEVDGRSVPLSISIGIARDAIGTNLMATMKQADLALYQAKSRGRDRFEVSHECWPAGLLAA